jgi:hypothetical protein
MDETTRSAAAGAMKALALTPTLMKQKHVYDWILDKSFHKMFDALWTA